MAKAAKRISFIDLADEVRREGEFTDTRHVVTVRRELMARIEASASPSTRRSNSSIALPGRSSGPPLRSSKTSTRPGTPRAPRLRPSAGRYERYQHRGRAPWWRTSPPSPPHHQPSPQKKKGLPMGARRATPNRCIRPGLRHGRSTQSHPKLCADAGSRRPDARRRQRRGDRAGTRPGNPKPRGRTGRDPWIFLSATSSRRDDDNGGKGMRPSRELLDKMRRSVESMEEILRVRQAIRRNANCRYRDLLLGRGRTRVPPAVVRARRAFGFGMSPSFPLQKLTCPPVMRAGFVVFDRLPVCWIDFFDISPRIACI